MEFVRLEDLWRNTLVNQEKWSESAVNRLTYSLAPSTLHSYNRMIERFAAFCETNDRSNSPLFPPDSTATVADFLCTVADASERPSSVLRTASAAIGHVYRGLGHENICAAPEVQMLITGLVKSGTTAPMKRSKVMPVQNFNDLFMAWADNDHLDIKELRIKAIALLALTVMLRPSDAAPKSRIHTAEGPSNLVFNVNQVEFSDNGAKITLFGIKNDTSRTGFEVTVPSGSNRKTDPVRTLQDYISRTQRYRGANGPVFISLKAPYGALSAASIARELERAISLAGLDGMGYSAKSFRPTGATSAIEGNIDPEIVRKVGRWKNSEVFFRHYVHSRTPEAFTDTVLSHE